MRGVGIPGRRREKGKSEQEGEEVIVQDNVREILLAERLGLKQMEGRWGHDAEDEARNPYELKTTTKNSFGTGRDVSPDMISEWRKRYWICTTGRNLKSGFEIHDIYFLAPEMLEDWFRHMEGRFAKDAELRSLVVERLRTELHIEQLDRLMYLMSRGMTYNNPHIGLPYVIAHGRKLSGLRPIEELRELVRQFPLKR